MNKFFIFLLLFFGISKSFLAQNGGYLGRNHNLGVEIVYQPVNNIYNDYRSNDQSPKNLFTLRPSYELTLAKNFSFISTFGFHHYESNHSVSSSNESSQQEGSFLFYDNLSSNSSSINEFTTSKFYVSGFDVVFKARLYSYKKKGKIAPMGNYSSLVLGFPRYKTYYANDVVEGDNLTNLGLEFGQQSIYFGYLTFDYGVRSSITVSSSSSLVNYYGSWFLKDYQIPSNQYGSYSALFNFYLKIGYLPW